MDIKKSVRIARAQTGISAKELADKCGMSYQNLHKRLNVDFGYKLLKKLADAFDMKVSEFVALGEG